MGFSSWDARVVRQCILLAGTAIGLAATSAHAQDSGAAGVDAQAGTPPATASGAAARHVDINEYYVEGNTVLSDPEIEEAVYPFLGPDKTLEDVEKARGALQKVYEARGLKTVFVEIPQQNVVGGRVRLVVSEAKIGQIAVSGEKHVSQKQVLSALPSVAAGRVPDLNAFSNELTALNSRAADRQVTPALKAGTVPGTVDVDLKVEDKLPLHGGIELSNRYSRDTTPLRLQANLRYDDLWGLGHSISGFYSVAPQRRSDAEVFVGSYGAPLGDKLRLDITGLRSNSDVATVGNTNVLGNGWSVTAALTRTLNGSPGFYHRVSLSVAYKDFKEDTRFVGTGGAAGVSKAPIHYVPISLSYSGSWVKGRGTLGFGLGGTFGLRALGSDESAFDNKRYRAGGGFAYLHGNVDYLYTLPHDFQLYTNIEGQLANQPLISNEEIALGGVGTVRGYLQSEAIGDNGLLSSIELRSPSLGQFGGDLIDTLRLVGFVDTGRVWVIDPLPDQAGSFGLVSIGGGLRLKLLKTLSGDLDVGVPLKDNGVTKAGDVRVHFRVSADF
ncbi:ShlB/FhaC/HecB family hemolysin secretion/activation protein [Sphingomonas sp. QA11]|uniref:ShlB/FhaC/HecB family hemolysin secretion/activation protein n=1 Tax=Sphingomonas sp. QA11 TaxID=2950605 RepID=UPI0023491D78|nr:ShlB/FhaC/HecB family hemolysin secretion/activation protein [Sphingomonas sp. QA11]WCM25954.1 ShlB/FhaC/HecB family hemolysin secretion/activation protein [Sphingomonas sp. QA11]